MIEAAVLIAGVALFVVFMRLLSPGARRAKCPECGEMVVASAKVCRYCGYRPEVRA